ncbi:MAG: hypothetical protein K2N21_06550 [Rikenellaceae bacterium]|nr:hypothetical protein [Rikenellaceae bacterium]
MKTEKPYRVRKNKEGYPRFPYRLSRTCRWMTAFTSILFAALFFYMLNSSSGTYLSAWFLSFIIAVALLFIISFPRNIVVTDTDLVVYGILEATYISLGDIKRMHRVPRRRLRMVIPVIGSFGFGGYYGYYFDLRNLHVIRLFATRLSGLVMVHTIYNDCILLSCEAADKLIALVKERTGNNMLDAPVKSDDDDD